MLKAAAVAIVAALLIPRQEPLKTPWGRIEWKADAAHLHVDAWPPDGRVGMPRLNNPIGAVYLSGDAARTPLAFQPNVNDWSVARPKKPSAEPDVIVVEVVGKPRVAGEIPVVDAAENGAIVLPAHLAAPHGRMLRYEPQSQKNTVGYWVDETDWVEWRFNAGRTGRFKVQILQGCGKGQGGSLVRIVVAGQALEYTVEDTGHFQKFVERTAGTVEIGKPGAYAVEIRPVRKAKAAVMDVREVKLVPAE